jgi:alanine dehydrogenase
MIVGVPKEIKDNENRVAAIPAGVQALVARGHKVLVQKGAGAGSGISDQAFEAAAPGSWARRGRSSRTRR